MATPFFVAEAPTVTILRSLASSAYGSYTLNLPDGIELEDVTDLDAPGNTLGYVASLQRGKRVGGLARSFIRADVTVTAADPSDPDVTPESDVHDVLDEARSRVSSDFFLESDITKAGMGAWIPYVDFNVGDRANISILDHVVNLPITRIESQVTDHSDTDFLVHVGGQLVSDEQARMAENMSLEKKFLQDRRELAGIEAATKQAQKTAESAEATAGDAKDIADDALRAATDADGVIQGYIDEGRQHVVDALGHADDARGYAENAFGEAERAVGLVADASLIIDQAQEKLDTIPAIIASGEQHVRDAQAHADVAAGLVVDAEAAADRADGHARDALELVDDALVLVDAADAALDLIEVELDKIPGLIAEGEQHVTNAKNHADRADQAVTDAGAAKTAAETALTNATNLLADIDGEGTDFPTAVTQVLGAHNDVLTKHGEVLNAHDEAIIAASDASRDAGLAAQSALDGVATLGLIQAEMIEVDRLQNRAIRAAAGAAAQASMAAMQAAETGRLAAQAAGEAGKAAASAGKAAQDALDAAGTLAAVQADSLEVQRLHGEAIVAVAGAASYAAGAAVDAAETGESAALAAEKALDAIEAMDQALTAKEAAEAARDQTIEDVSELAWLSHFRRPRIAYFDRSVNGQTFSTNLFFDDGSPSFYVNANAERLWLSKRGTWSGTMKVQVMTTTSAFGMISRAYNVGSDGTEEWHANFGDAVWQRFIVELYPEFPDAATKTKFESQAVAYKPLM